MAIRYRTRLTLTVSALILFIVTVMTVAVVILFINGLTQQFWDNGRFITTLATQSIEYGVTLNHRVQEQSETSDSEFEIQGFLERFIVGDDVERIAVISPEGKVVAAIDSDGGKGAASLSSSLVRAAEEFLANEPGASVEGAMMAQEMDGARIDIVVSSIGVFTRLENATTQGTPHALVIQFNTMNQVSFVSNRAAALISLGLAMLFIGFIVSVFLSRGLSKPIVQLTHQVREFGKGNLNLRLTWKRKDEFRDLAETFNIMAISLQEYMHELERETSHRERLESELRIASQLQTTLLPESPPEVDGLELVGWSQPSREVGGDFYDFIELEPGKVAIVLGDATGKGLSAALLITQCASILRAISGHVREPGELLRLTNEEFYRRVGATHRFVTLSLVVIDTNRGVATFANAGHPPPILMNGSVDKYEWVTVATGFPLGIVKDAEFNIQEVSLEFEDTIVIYSDGVTEAQNAERELYGEERVDAFLGSVANASKEDILNGLRDDAERHMAGQEHSDDMTIVVARFTKKSSVPVQT